MVDDLTTLSAMEQVDLLRRRQISSRELLAAHLDRIRALPEINAVVAVDEAAALQAAEAVDTARTRGDVVGPLAGLPSTIKHGW